MKQLRPPIVTILGHVDHGKTTLLDYIRKSSVAQKEHGGITQHIGAYQVEHDGKVITFIDTPGHAAFEKMRSRGAGVADIAVLVVALDDGVMPQTVEAIKHIQAAKVSLIVAVNKIDLPGVDVKIQLEKIKKQLSDNKVLMEEYGGDVPLISLSAKTGEGVDKLLEMILLVAELHELKGDPLQTPSGVVIEAHLDKSKGPVATLLLRDGTLRKGDQIMLGGVRGKIRGVLDWSGSPMASAGPSTPIEILGLEAVPEVGAVVGEESRVNPPAGRTGSQESRLPKSLIDKLRQEKTTVLNVVLKADKQGSLEAIIDGLEVDDEHIKVISSGTGDILDSDIELAATTHSIVIGFNVKIAPTATKLAEAARVLVRTYTVIYELLDEMKEVVEKMLKVGALEEVLGIAQIVAEFPYGKADRIAGCKVLEGQISKGPRIKIIRGDPAPDGAGQEKIGETKIKSLKKVKEEVAKVEKGEEFGAMFDPPIDFQIGDIIQSFRIL